MASVSPSLSIGQVASELTDGGCRERINGHAVE